MTKNPEKFKKCPSNLDSDGQSLKKCEKYARKIDCRKKILNAKKVPENNVTMQKK